MYFCKKFSANLKQRVRKTVRAAEGQQRNIREKMALSGCLGGERKGW